MNIIPRGGGSFSLDSCRFEEASGCLLGQLWALCMNFMNVVCCYNVDYILLSIKVSLAESHVKMFRCSSVSGTDPFPICRVVSVHLDVSVCRRRCYWTLLPRKLQDIHKYRSNGHNSLKWPYYITQILCGLRMIIYKFIPHGMWSVWARITQWA